jgi:hypothetical protein
MTDRDLLLQINERVIKLSESDAKVEANLSALSTEARLLRRDVRRVRRDQRSCPARTREIEHQNKLAARAKTRRVIANTIKWSTGIIASVATATGIVLSSCS